MDLSTIFFSIFLTYLAFRDLRNLDRSFAKGIILHLIAILFLTFNYANSFSWLGKAILNFGEFQKKLYVKVGFLSEKLHFIIFIIYILFGLLIMSQLFGIVRREQKSRLIIIKYLPFAIPITTIISYSISERNGQISGDDFKFLLAYLIFSCIIFGLIRYLYKSKLIVNLFEEKIKSIE